MYPLNKKRYNTEYIKKHPEIHKRWYDQYGKEYHKNYYHKHKELIKAYQRDRRRIKAEIKNG